MTGDVHRQGMKRADTTHVQKSELSLAREYAEIARRHNIDVTLFMEGSLCKERPRLVRSIAAMENVEVGGHTFTSFHPRWLHVLFMNLSGSEYGPRVYQEYDIKRSLNTLGGTIGDQISSWRTHSYKSNRHTYEILKETNVKVISDVITTDDVLSPERGNKLVSLPVNTLRDDGHMLITNRTKEIIQKDQYHGDWFNTSYYTAEEWLEQLKEQIQLIVKQGGVATVQAHPIYMKAADDFSTFEDLCRWIRANGYRSICARDIAE